tara:strand:+ start:711 stop:1403 length:693 start_codon:yes stop_codon:yes gene_type:complete
MSTVYKVKRSEVAERVPSSADLVEGELALNLADAKIFSKRSDGTVVSLNPVTNNTTTSYYLPGDLGEISTTAGDIYNLGIVTDSPSADSAGFNELSANTFTLGTQSFPASDGTAGQVITTDGNGNLSWVTSATSNSWVEKTSDYTATSGDKIIVNSTSSAITITLPANPTFGDEISIIDGSSNAATNNITVDRNTRNIDGDSSDMILDVNGAAFNIVYYNPTRGWIFTER